jgi:pterin-4a-carbinolamine dehydratase
VLFTYSAKGLTDVDFELAHAIDAIPCNYSIGWKNEHSGKVI